MNQRWLLREHSFRPDEAIRTVDYDVAEIADDTTPKGFVLEHHYSGTFPAARFRFGLYRHGALQGVAVFGIPVRKEVLKPLPWGIDLATELSRFVLLDEVPGNGETWFLGHCFRLLRGNGQRGVVSFSDPMPRTRRDGERVFPGHVGRIYQAHNAIYVGRGRARTLRILDDGTVFSDRAATKIISRAKGWRYAAGILERRGAEPLGDGDSRAWLERWVALLTRPLKHRGNHKYAWALDRTGRKSLPAPRAYPKELDA